MAILVDDINAVYITGYIEGEGTVTKTFTGVGRDSIGWDEVVWGAGLTRSNTFALENIDDVEIGKVPQCTLNFPYMTIEDYIVMQKLLVNRHVIVNYFNFDKGIREEHEMAVTGNERKKFYSTRRYVRGISNFTIKFVATNRDYKYVDLTIDYYGNGADSGDDKTNTYKITDQVEIDDGSDYVKTGYHLKEWNTKADGTGQSYAPNFSLTLWQSLKLYAIWEA